MTKIDIHPLQQVIELRLLADVLEMGHLTGQAAGIRPIPMVRGAKEQRFIAYGTAADVARLLEIAPASADNPSTAGAAPSNEIAARELFEKRRPFLPRPELTWEQQSDIAKSYWFAEVGSATGAAQSTAGAGCRWPLCQPEHVQQAVADQAYRELYSGDVAPVAQSTAGGLMRYSFDPTAVEEADPHGEWVKFSDVESLLAAPALNPSEVLDAERYRYLRDHYIGDDPEAINLDAAKKPGLDAAVDAAIRAMRTASKEGGAA